VTSSPNTVLRLALLVFAALIVQISGFERILVLGGQLDLVALVVAAIALSGGSVPGALTGFSAGLLLDLALGQNLGVSSLVLTIVGYGVGRYAELRDPGHGLIPIPVAVVATAGYGLGIAVVSFMLEIGASVSALVFRDMLLTMLFNAIVALPVFALVRRLLRSALLVDPRARRRRAPVRSGPIGLRGLGL